MQRVEIKQKELRQQFKRCQREEYCNSRKGSQRAVKLKKKNKTERNLKKDLYCSTNHIHCKQ